MSTWRGETSGPALWPGLAAAGAVATVPCAGLVRPGLSGTTSALLTAASLRWPAPPAHPHTDGAESAASEVGCSYRTLVTTECHVEPGPDGAPVRRCEMLRRTFRQCPGRPMEELESTTEETTVEPLTSAPSSAAALGEPWMMRPGERYGGGKDPDFLDIPRGGHPGELPAAKMFDEFFALAQQLQAGLDQEIENNPELQAALPSGMLPPDVARRQLEPPEPRPGLFQWLFGGGRSGGRPPSATTYNGYERDFQDV
eukprot:jgi/Tetstr1/437296/TSEL_002780.t1